jgi:putative lipoprotein
MMPIAAGMGGNVMQRLSGILAVAALGFGAACAGSSPASQDAGAKNVAAPTAIEGTAAYRERTAMPPGAEFEAVLQDVSRADAPAMEIARATIPNAPNPPIRFTIPFDAAKIHARHSYSVRAVIRADGQLLFSSDAVYPVLTHGAGHTVDILLKRAAVAPAADSALMNTPWKILSIAGEPLQAIEGKREPRLILLSENGRDSWSATIGCNQMSGGLDVNGDRIEFKAGMATLMACPPPLDMLEKQLGQSLMASTHWRIQGNRLELRDDAGGQTFLCEAAHPE